MTGLAEAFAWLHSFLGASVIARSRGPGLPVRVVMRNGSKRLDGPTVNYSFGTLHTIFGEALRRIEVRRRAPRSVLLLGLGAGSVVALLRRDHRIEAPIVGVEIDPDVVRLATEHFRLRRWAGLEVVVADAAEFVTREPRFFDLVVVDVFVDSVVPARLREEPFVGAVRDRLAAGGMLLWNVITDDDVGRASGNALAATLRTLFPVVTPMAIRSNVVFAATTAISTPRAAPG